MHPLIEAAFDQAEQGYLPSAAIAELDRYVGSLPLRLETYRLLRDREVAMMQAVADQLTLKLPQAETMALEQNLLQALLLLRHCALGMLLEDPLLLEEPLQGWRQRLQAYRGEAIAAVLYPLLVEVLQQTLNPSQLQLLQPLLTQIQAALPAATAAGFPVFR